MRPQHKKEDSAAKLGMAESDNMPEDFKSIEVHRGKT